MTDVVDAGSVSVETTSSAPDLNEIATSASHGAGIPQTPSSPASDPQPVETPVVTEPLVQAPQPQETPVIETPEELPQPPAAAAATPLSIKDRAYAALEKLRFNKRAKLDKVVALAAKKRSIKNDDVEKLLRVSDSTAQRYLNQLMKEGKLRRVGSPKQPTYEPF